MPTTDTASLTQAGLNLIQQALSIYDSDLRLAVCNRMFHAMFDLPERLVTPGAPFADTIQFLVERGEYGDVEDVDGFVAERVAQAKAFEPHYIERTRPDGRVISVEGSPLPQGGWVTVYTDITGIKAQERLLRGRSEELSDQLLSHAEELATANRALAATNAALEEARRAATEMEARTRLTTEMMPAHIARLGPDRRYSFSNRRLGAVIPGCPADILGLTMQEALGAEAYSRILPHLDRAYAGHGGVFEFTHGPSTRRIRVSFTPDQGPGQRVQGVYVLSMDITEEAQARTALAQAAQRQMAAQLTSGMAHDFANLLTVILGLQSKLSRMPLPTEALELTAAIKVAAQRGGALLDQIAGLAEPRQMALRPVDLAAFLKETVGLASPSLPDDMQLTYDVGAIDGRVMLDPDALRDALLNLVLNARDAISGAGVRDGRITIKVRHRRDTWLDISVSDTGPGFSPEGLEKGLTPFFTTKGEDGTGLGLSMVYDIVKLAGGRVTLGVAPKGGGLVSLQLPLRAAPPGLPPTLILLVEDAIHIREMLRDQLVEAGHSVIEAATVDEAISLLDVPGLGLVLSDIMLRSDQNGLDVAKAAQARGISVALMTSLQPDAPLFQAAQGHWPVLRKPLDIQRLVHVMEGRGNVR